MTKIMDRGALKLEVKIGDLRVDISASYEAGDDEGAQGRSAGHGHAKRQLKNFTQQALEELNRKALVAAPAGPDREQLSAMYRRFNEEIDSLLILKSNIEEAIRDGHFGYDKFLRVYARRSTGRQKEVKAAIEKDISQVKDDVVSFRKELKSLRRSYPALCLVFGSQFRRWRNFLEENAGVIAQHEFKTDGFVPAPDSVLELHSPLLYAPQLNAYKMFKEHSVKNALVAGNQQAKRVPKD